MKAIKDLKTAQEIRRYLLNVLSRTGGKNKRSLYLYHYSKIQSIASILETGYIWLGSTESMNDYLEYEIINSAEDSSRLSFACFSRIEENLAMYKMYAPSPNGAMLAISFKTAQEIIDKLPTTNGKKIVRIVRDNKLTDETINADIYWAAVAYQDLHTPLLKSETVTNTNISNPINEPDLAGFVKLYGWEYEKEVRLCAWTEKPLGSNEKIAIEIPAVIQREISVITGPAFDKKKNRRFLATLKRIGITVHDSQYDELVDLGYSTTQIDKEQYEKLQKENEVLKEKIEQYKSTSSNKIDEWGLEYIFKTRAEKNAKSDPLLENHSIKQLDGIAFGLRAFRTNRKKDLLKCMDNGANIRLLVMDPKSDFIKQKAYEEGVEPDSMAKSIQDLTEWVRSLNRKSNNGKIRLKYYNAMTLDFYWRLDNYVYIGPYWYGTESQQTITYEYRKGGRGFKLYSEHFEELWNNTDLTTEIDVTGV